ncbi:hypothetical protein [Aeromicrobium flavum]|nr:hypothetical protein [Aeromicrobium flavum]
MPDHEAEKTQPRVTPGGVRGQSRGAGPRHTPRSEWLLAGGFSVLLAVVMTWPLARDAGRVIPHDLGDPLLQAYSLGWLGESLRSDPGGLWGSNSFWPAPDSFLFTDTLLGYGPFAMLITGYTSALVVYNVLFIGTFALAFFGMYVLLRQLGARCAGSAVGAAVFAYSPWKLAHLGHLNILSAGGIVLSLALFARGHGWSLRHGFRPERQQPGWVIAGWLVALWQFSIGAALGLAFMYVLLVIAVIVGGWWLLKRPAVRRSIIVADGAGGTIFALGVLWIASKHAAVADAYPEVVRPYDYVKFFSPTMQGFITAPSESRLWGAAHEAARADMTWAPEQTLLVGFTALVLAVAGLTWSVWSGRQRIGLALGIAITTALALGPNFYHDGAWTWQVLYDYAPGFDSVRSTGRTVLYLTIILGILVAGLLTKAADTADELATVIQRGRDSRGPILRAPRRVHALLFLPLALVLFEGLSSAQNFEPRQAPVAVSRLEGPALFLPSDGRDTNVQFWTIDGFVDMANGSAAFTPAKLEKLRDTSKLFPSASSLRDLRGAGIKTVVVIPAWLPGSEWSSLDTTIDPPGVDVERTGEAVIYHLDAD